MAKQMVGKIWAQSIIAILLLSSCSHLRTTIEDKKYLHTISTFEEIVPEYIRERCGYNLDLPKPKTYPANIVKHGSYYMDTKTVVYPVGKYRSLLHEYMHYINHNGKYGEISRECLEEVLSIYSAKLNSMKEHEKSFN